MLRQFYLFILIFLWEQHSIFTAQPRQEGATIKYFNRKYVSECTAFTGRRKRGEPYKTNVTFANIHPWANNMTFCVKYSLGGTEMVLIRTLGCDIMKIDWLSNYLETYSNLPKKCPLAPGVHAIYNMELPPKNIPIIVPKGRYHVKITLQLTSTNEAIIEFNMIIHV